MHVAFIFKRFSSEVPLSLTSFLLHYQIHFYVCILVLTYDFLYWNGLFVYTHDHDVIVRCGLRLEEMFLEVSN